MFNQFKPQGKRRKKKCRVVYRPLDKSFTCHKHQQTWAPPHHGCPMAED